MKTSIVMANYNRRKLLINTLKTIEYYNLKRDIEVIIVDDCSSGAECVTDLPKLFKIPVIIISITRQEKNWTCDVIPFNIGFSFATGDVIIIQNPENLHIGDIVGYALENLKENVFLSFALYSMNQADTDNLVAKTINKKKYSGQALKKAIGKTVGKIENWKDGDTCWYNHSKHRPEGCHLISAITRADLEDLSGFDERYGKGFAYSDTELHERILKKKMDIRIIDEPFAVHQRHALAKYKENNREFERNQKLFLEVTRREKIYRAPANSFYHPLDKSVKPVKLYGEMIIEDPILGDTESSEILNLGDIPLVNHLCATREKALQSKKYPLSLQIFNKSRLTCLTEVVDKTDLFRDYVYHSGTSEPFKEHCSDMFDYLKKYVNLRKYNLVIDIGGNDGTLIREFRKKAPYLKYLNVDASNAFIDANREAGIEYEQKFFDEKFLYPEENKAKLIVSTNVFQHTTPIRSFVRGIVNNLSDHGVWCLEFPYLMTTVFNDNYDQVYHEHVYYFTLTNIIDLLKQEGLTVFNVSFNNIHTGTMRVLSCPTNDLWLSADRTVENFLNLEKYITPEYMVGWGNRLQEKIKSFKNFFDRLKSEGKVIVGFGAAAKGCVFLSSIGVDYKTIPVIIDDTPEKQGKYMPGTGILISPRSALKKIKPDYILILAHNFADYIIKSLEDEYEGKFIIMFPDVKIL